MHKSRTKAELKKIVPGRLAWSTFHKVVYDDVLDCFMVEYWTKPLVIVLASPLLFVTSLLDSGLRQVNNFSTLFNKRILAVTYTKSSEQYAKFKELHNQ